MPQANQTPALVNWIGYLAIALLLVLPLSVLTVRSGAWQQGLLLYALSCLGCLLLFALSGLLLLLPRYAGSRSAIGVRMLIALPGTLLLLSLLAGRGDYPPIHDITTDTQDPPLFVTAEKQRGEGANTLEIDPDAIESHYHQDRNAGIIEAVDTTAIMAFRDDVVIRLRTNADGTLVDLRSVSRVGIGDIGANAKRIRAFQQAFIQ
jgi:hypothetical protein